MQPNYFNFMNRCMYVLATHSCILRLFLYISGVSRQIEAIQTIANELMHGRIL